jgi:hypothetical protein
MTPWRARQEDARNVLVDAFGPYHPPPLRDWPARALLAALILPAGRRHLRARFDAWATLPGDRWEHFQRDLVGTVVSVRGRGLERVIELELDPPAVPPGQPWVIERDGFVISGYDWVGPPPPGRATITGDPLSTGWVPLRH